MSNIINLIQYIKDHNILNDKAADHAAMIRAKASRVEQLKMIDATAAKKQKRAKRYA